MKSILKNLFVLACIIAGIILLLWGKGCFCGHGATTTTDTVTVFHTQYRDTSYKVKPDTIIQSKTVTDLKFDTLYVDGQEVIKVDTVFILKDYSSKVVYNDTQKVDYGNVIIHDTIFQNRISARRLETNFTIPTVTITKQAPQRFVVSVLAAGQYDEATKKVSVGGGLNFKNKKGYSLAALVLFGVSGDRNYQLQFGVPISLRKK